MPVIRHQSKGGNSLIIDAHVHFLPKDWVSDYFWNDWVRVGSTLTGRTSDEVKKRMPEVQVGGEALLKEMDDAGVDSCLVVNFDVDSYPTMAGKVPNAEKVKVISEWVREHPTRIMSLASVDPRRPGAAEEFERQVRDYGCKGVKLHPCVGYYPNDSFVYPIYQKALELAVPVWIHTGIGGLPMQSKFAWPVWTDDVAYHFPDVNFVLCHAGIYQWSDACSVACIKSNVHLEMSAWQGIYRSDPRYFYQTLRTILNAVGHSRVLFGSDWPMFRPLFTESEWVKAFKEAPKKAKEFGIKFSQAEIDSILGNNAARLLKLQS
jgi:predicted TIM-barrel fold metal-dependent hydrolase